MSWNLTVKSRIAHEEIKKKKKGKIGVDKRWKAWYYVKAVREGSEASGSDVPCKLNNEKHKKHLEQ